MEKFETLRGADSIKYFFSQQAAMNIDGTVLESYIYKNNQDHNLYGYFILPLSQQGERFSGFNELVYY